MSVLASILIKKVNISSTQPCNFFSSALNGLNSETLEDEYCVISQSRIVVTRAWGAGEVGIFLSKSTHFQLEDVHSGELMHRIVTIDNTTVLYA